MTPDVSLIHPSAVVAPGARLGAGVEVGPYAVIGPYVTIGEKTWVGPHAVIEGRTTIGRENRIFQFASVGAIPQVILHGISGMLFKSGDTQALAEILERLLDAPWLIGQLGRRGRARVELRYSLERMADNYRQHYTELTKTG